MRSILLLSLALGPAALLGQTNLIVNPSFEEGDIGARPSGWNTIPILQTGSYSVRTQPGTFNPPDLERFRPFGLTIAPAVTTPAFAGATDGNNIAVLYRNGRDVTNGNAFLYQEFTVPEGVTSASFQVDYAYSTNVPWNGNTSLLNPHANYVEIGIYDGLTLLESIFLLDSGPSESGFTTLPAYDLTALFQERAGETLALVFQLRTPGSITLQNQYLNFAIDNVLLLFSDYETMGGGAGGNAAAAANNTQNQTQVRRRQLINQQIQAFKAHQARVAREQRLAAARRAAAR